MKQTVSFINKWVSFLLLCLITSVGITQTYPTYGPEKTVTIIGLTTDAMEPFLSPDGNYLFYNNLNDGINTRLYYASSVNDSTFNFIGELNGTNQQTPPHLDAVPGLDLSNNFYWVSTRDYPLEFDNLFHGTFNSGNVTNIGRLHGDFYIYSPGWILMDHGISFDGQLLYFNNARFNGDNCPGPCETRIGVAQKANDSTFIMLPNSTQIMEFVNDPNYKNYAPAITQDELELYYTRFPQGPIDGSTLSQICVVVRNNSFDNFSTPLVLFSDFLGASIVEAPTLTADKQIMYYHKKINGIHKIMMRYREIPVGIPNYNLQRINISISPNPMQDKTIVEFDHHLNISYSLFLLDHLGNTVRTFIDLSKNQIEIHRDNLSSGLYIVQLRSGNKVISTHKLIVN